MKIALERKLIEAKELTELLINELLYLKENIEADCLPDEIEYITMLKEKILDDYDRVSKVKVIPYLAGSIGNVNELLDHLYYRQTLVLKILKACNL